VGLVACLAFLATGVILAGHLGKVSWLSEVGLVAARAKNAGIWQLWYYRSRIFHMLLQSAVARFTIDVPVFTDTFGLHHFIVTVCTGFMSGECYRLGCDVFKCVGSIMPVAPKALRNEHRAHKEEKEYRGHEYCRKPEKMFGVPELGQASSLQVLG
jgi:hypothetical protein